MKSYAVFILIISLLSCREDTKNNISADFIDSIEKAHKKTAFLEHEAIRYHLDLSFNGKERFKGRISFLTNSAKVRLDYDNGMQLIYDGKQVFQSPDTIQYAKARFDMFTWSYFFALPYKLKDAGTHISATDKDTLNNHIYTSAKLTFDSGTGDSPKDWYMIYKNDSTDLIKAAAYIVTLNKSLNQAEENPHAIRYENYLLKNNIPMASKWTFWEWEKGSLTKKIGEGSISEIQFFRPRKSYFEPPQSSKIISL